jgi:hypothetical protein
MPNISRHAIYSDDKEWVNHKEHLRFNMEKVAEVSTKLDKALEAIAVLDIAVKRLQNRMPPLRASVVPEDDSV